MSLINDALKKAQRQRTGDTAPSPLSTPPMPGGSAAPLRSAPKKDPSPTLILVGAGVTVGLVLGIGAFWFLRRSDTPAPTRSEPTVAANVPTVSARATPLPADAGSSSSTAPATVNPAPAAAPVVALSVPTTTPAATPPQEKPPLTLPASASPSPAPAATESAVSATPAPTVLPSEPTTTVATTPINPTSAAPAPAVALKATGPAEPSESMVKAIEGFRIMGIRAAGGADAKVLMNDRVFRIGDLVDRPLGIRLTGATANSLTFQDGSGASYTRNF